MIEPNTYYAQAAYFLAVHERTLWLIAAWTCFWFVAHHFVWAWWKCDKVYVVVCIPSPVDRYRRRLARSQVYCTLAAVGGIWLLSRCRWHPQDLLFDYSVEHEVLFTMAVGHWLIAIWEDLQSSGFLKSGLTDQDLQGVADPNEVLLRSYLLHHILAAGGYAAVLLLRACTGLAAFGLVFEIPVLLMNHREFVICAEEPPSWFQDIRQVDLFWTVLNVVFAVARGGPSLVYFYSLAYWMDDLHSLSREAQLVYHGMALFFTTLNYSLYSVFFTAWCNRDREQVTAFLHRELDEFDTGNSEKGRPHINHNVMPIVQVREQDLASRNGSAFQPDVWIEVDGIAYDVTQFLKEHPGGEAPLRKYAGSDASEAFHRVRHSMKARMTMQKYMVGPIVRGANKYSIFQHNDSLLVVFWEGVVSSLPLGLVACLLGWGGLGMPPLSAPDIEPAALPGLIVATLFGCVVCVVALCVQQFVFSALLWPGAHGVGLCLAVHFTSLAVARRPLPSGISPSMPTGIEIGAVILFFLEDMLEVMYCGKFWARSQLLGGGVVAASWALREVHVVPQVAPGHMMAGLAFAFSTVWLVRRVGGTRPREVIVTEVFMGGILCAAYGALGLRFLWASRADVRGRLEAIEFSPSNDYWYTGLTVVVSIIAIATRLNSGFVCSPSWSSRAAAFTLLCGSSITGVFNYRWVMTLGFVIHLYAVGYRTRSVLEAARAAGIFSEVHPCLVGTQALWDQARAFVCTIGWKAVIMPLTGIINYMLPDETRVYACNIPIFDLGDTADLGVAAYFAPQAAKGSKDPHSGKPDYFVCNVGHIDTTHAAGLSDMQLTMNALGACWSEFKKPEVKGMIANVVAVFPSISGTTFAKEINLSAWESAQAAHEWYTSSEGHARVMKQHNSGLLRTFGNLLASLKPVGKVRHQDRCSRCARLVEAENLGDRAPRYCGVCGARTFGYTYF